MGTQRYEAVPLSSHSSGLTLCGLAWHPLHAPILKHIPDSCEEDAIISAPDRQDKRLKKLGVTDLRVCLR